jgi:SRSO17 transposase
MINVDGCDNPKKGKNSVGVKRQYCGTLGKKESCQAGIFIGYSSSKGYGLIERNLYIPEEWLDESHAGLREKCGVPKEMEFKNKNRIASELINKTITSGVFPAKWIGADGAFGADKAFLDSIPEGYYYFADVPSYTCVWTEMPEVFIPNNEGSGRRFKNLRASTKPVPVPSIAADNSIPWQRVILAEGAKGPIVADVKCLRVIDSRDSTGGRHYPLPNKEIWLYIRRFADGHIKYSLCNAPADTPMETLNQVATMRWPIEQCFEECMSYLGMDHCEARSWNSWYRHMLFVFISHLFLQEIRLRFKKNCLF